MGLFEAILLGLIQGITEFLPISSSAHVQIAQSLLQLDGISRPQLTAFIATIQLGTEFAVLLYFFKQVLEISKAWLKQFHNPWRVQSSDSKMGWLIIVGTLPIVVLGLTFENQIENQLRSLWIIGFTLIGFGLLLGLADRFGRKEKPLSELTFAQGLVFGFGQAMALVPGVSRSGGSITVGLLMGFSRAAAARYSFLLAIPAVLASGFYQFGKSYSDLPSELLLATVLATVISFVTGYSVIAWFMRYLERGSFLPFVIYRVLVGTALLIALSFGWIVDLN